jgi:hypothetical protein
MSRMRGTSVERIRDALMVLAGTRGFLHRLSTIALVLLLAACGPGGQTLTGEFTLFADEFGGPPCSGTGGYGDIRQGVDVVVRNEAGEIIGTSSLGPGERRRSDSCTFTFEVANLPVAAFYSIEVADRGDLTYSREDLDAMEWHVAMTLGD